MYFIPQYGGEKILEGVNSTHGDGTQFHKSKLIII